MPRLDARRLIESLDSDVRTSACTGRAKHELTRLCLRRRDELAHGGNTSQFACDQDVRLARKRNDRDEIPQGVIGEVLQRRAVGLGAGVDEQRITIGW